MNDLERWFEARKEAGRPVKRYELARRVGCSKARISQILQGDEPSLALAAKLSRETGIPIDKFARQSEPAE